MNQNKPNALGICQGVLHSDNTELGRLTPCDRVQYTRRVLLSNLVQPNPQKI